MTGINFRSQLSVKRAQNRWVGLEEPCDRGTEPTMTIPPHSYTMNHFKTNYVKMNIAMTVAVAGLIVIFFSGKVYAEPRPRDVWYSFMSGKVRYGRQHRVVTKLPEGNFRYVVHTLLLINLFGLQRQEITTQAKYIVTPTYEPVSFQITGSQASGTLEAHGRVDDGELRVSFKRAELGQKRVFTLDGKTIFQVCMDDWLADQPLAQQSLALSVFDESLWEVLPVTAERVTRDNLRTLWVVSMAPLSGKRHMTLDPAGVMRELKSEAPPLHLVRTSDEDIKDLSYLEMSGRQVLMFPIKDNIGRPELLKSLTVNLTWKDIPFDDFRFEDDRQHIVKRAIKGRRTGVQLRISSPEPFEQRLTLPIEGAEFLPYLKETRLIKPKDERILAQAREWTAGTQDALEATKAICERVSAYLQGGSLIVETLSGPEMLQCKQGKYSEFTTFFASLARSVGIPTRVVLGERIMNGNWAGHMWCEAYVGRWITVDATVNEVGNSMALVKICHSDSVYGIQDLRFALPQSMTIFVHDFEKMSSPLEEEFTTGINGQAYTNVDFACQITAPSDDWSLVDKSEEGPVLIQFKVTQRNDVFVHFSAFSLPPAIGPEVLVDLRRVQIETMHDNFEVLENEPHPVQNDSGQRIVFQYTTKRSKQTMKSTEVLWRHGSNGYLFYLIATEADHDKYEEDYYAILKSFTVLTKSNDDVK